MQLTKNEVIIMDVTAKAHNDSLMETGYEILQRCKDKSIPCFLWAGGAIYHMLGGINEWIAEGYPVKPRGRSFSVQNQFLLNFLEKFSSTFPFLRNILRL